MVEMDTPSPEKNGLPSLNRGQMVGLGFMFLLLGFAQFAGAAWFVSKAGAIRKEAEQQETSSRSACMDSLKQLSFSVETVKESKNILRALKRKIDDPALHLGEASVATLACPGWQLTNFCMGEGCEKAPGGIWLEITSSR